MVSCRRRGKQLSLYLDSTIFIRKNNDAREKAFVKLKVQVPWTKSTSYKPNLESCRQYKLFWHKSQTLVHVGHILDNWFELSFGR